MNLGFTYYLILLSTSLVFCTKQDEIIKDLARNINLFGDILYKRVSKEKGNVVVSPVSVHAALSLLALGADEETLEELISFLFFSGISDLRRDYSVQTTDRRNMLGEGFLTVNSMFLHKQYPLLEQFAADAKSVLGADPQNLDFNKPQEATTVINQWIATKTNGEIPNIIHDNSLDNSSIIILLNAMYFKGQWKLKFDESETQKDSVFYTPQGEVKCNMMRMIQTPQKFNYVFQGIFHLIEMDLHSENIKIAFVKPAYEYNRTMQHVEEYLSANTFFQNIEHLVSKYVKIAIPKLKITKEYFLKRFLVDIGISDIFNRPNLSKLISRHALDQFPGVQVSEINHGAYLELNEDGVTAGAATSAMIGAGRSAGYNFILDKPFLFFIYDRKPETIYMRGRIENPLLQRN